MSLLPDIDENGQLILSKEEKKVITNPEKKAKLKERLEMMKAKKLEESFVKADESMADLNNMGHKEITPDFEDSPFADRVPLENEEDEIETETEE